MAGIRLEVDDRNVAAALQNLLHATDNLQPVLNDIGEILINSTRERLEAQIEPSGQAFTPLKPQTLKRKKRNRDKVLIYRGDLFRELAYQANTESLEFGSDRIYAARQHFGDDSRNHVARPFIGLTPQDEDLALEAVKQHLLHAVK